MQKLRSALCLIVLLITAGTLLGQAGATGTILGTVTDATGAVLPGAKVTITNVNTNQAKETVTTSAGDFNVAALNPGQYQVTVEATGFQKQVVNQLTLTVNQKLRVDASMNPGAVTSTVEVAAQSVTLDTDSASQSTLLSSQQVANLPLNGRNFMQLLLVTPGAVTIGGEQGSMRQGVGNAVSINGGRPEGNNYTLDGLINTDQALVTPAVILSQDAIQEFKVESGTYSAEFGFSASQINLVSKGGSNTLHGAIFEFHREDGFDAKPFATATDYLQLKTPTSKTRLRQNQFGYVLDGPVLIPHVYDGRNKTFFMANYEGWRIGNGGRIIGQTPNPAALAGNFSAETAIGGGPLPAYGSAACTTALNANQNCMPVDPLTGLPFPGNVIPVSRITNRLALVAQKYGFFPAPTVANQGEGATNYAQNISFPLTTNQQTYRIDQSLGRFGNIFGRETYSKYQNSFLSQSINPTLGILSQYETQKNWAISHTINLGKSVINNFRFGYLDALAPQGGIAPPPDAISALGVQNTFTKFSALQQTWPSINLTQFSVGGGPINAYTGSDSPSWEYADTLSWVHGKHTIGTGIDYRRWRLIRNLADDFYGDWSFAANNAVRNTAGCTNSTGLCGSGNAIADLLLGYYSGANTFVPGPLSSTSEAGNPQTHIFSYLGPYVQDDWKASQKLTLNVGVRWDFRAAPYEEHNHFFWRDLTNAQGGLCYADPVLSTNGVAPAGNPYLRYCGSVPRAGSKDRFAPRFGFAYRINDKTVVRGGYGIFWDSFEGREIDNSGDIYPYSLRLGLNPTNDATLPKLGNSLFPSYGALGPFPNPVSGFFAVIQSPDPHNPYVQSRTLSFEREIARNTTLELSYVGNFGTHLLNRRNIAQPVAITAANLPFCQANPNDVTHLCPTSNRRPFPNFSFFIDSDFHGYSHYDAGNIKLDRRAGDLAVTAVYTWSKSLDNKSATAGVGASGNFGWQGFMDNQRPNLDYSESDFSVSQRFVSSYIYQLPFGKGKRMIADANGVVDALVGGWQLTGITTFQSGFPLSIGAADALGLNGTFGQRANYVAGCNVHSTTPQFQRINPACFTQPAPGTYGNSSRSFLRQPGVNNWDMGLGKFITIHERAKLELHVDTFNTFNHHQYAINAGGLATGGNGGTSINTTIGNPQFGMITGASPARQMQLSAKITF